MEATRMRVSSTASVDELQDLTALLERAKNRLSRAQAAAKEAAVEAVAKAWAHFLQEGIREQAHSFVVEIIGSLAQGVFSEVTLDSVADLESAEQWIKCRTSSDPFERWRACQQKDTRSGNEIQNPSPPDQRLPPSLRPGGQPIPSQPSIWRQIWRMVKRGKLRLP